MPLRVQTPFFRAILLALLATACGLAGDPPIPTVTVCEVLADIPAHEGKEVAVLGRFSFRRDGRWIGEQSCGEASTAPPMLWLTEDSAVGPKPPANFEFDSALLNKQFAAMVKRTTLGKFRFGTPEYDRWAVVYGRVVAHKADKKAAADLVFRGDGVVIFLTTER